MVIKFLIDHYCFANFHSIINQTQFLYTRLLQEPEAKFKNSILEKAISPSLNINSENISHLIEYGSIWVAKSMIDDKLNLSEEEYSLYKDLENDIPLIDDKFLKIPEMINPLI